MRRFTIYALILTVLVIAVFNVHGWLVLSRSRAALEEELGNRLETLAKTIATQLRDEEFTPERARTLNETMNEADLFNIFLVDESLRYVFNVREPEAAGTSDPALELDATEILSAFSGMPTRTRLFAAGPYYLKTAYATVYSARGTIDRVLGVEADARFFRNLTLYRNSLLFINGLSLLALVALVLALVSVARHALKLEQAAARASTFALLGEMAAALAHEIRNPLATILAATDRLRIRYGAENDQTFDYIREEVERLNRTLTNYLSIGAGKLGEMEEVELGAVINQVLLSMEEELNRNGVRIENRLEQLPRVRGSELQLRQVFMNLFLNALQAQPQGGLLRIEGKTVEKGGRRWLVVMITDHGPGIPKEYQKRVFEPFFTTKEKGSGLGLFVVRRIVEMHQGAVRLTSTPEQGTTVAVWLPV
ncbi:MAG: hypothetical protein K6T77_01505 [candidate division WOR-3 bacterium]|nr:hypothetical protein [candidate division WOR-3 bacterium]